MRFRFQSRLVLPFIIAVIIALPLIWRALHPPEQESLFKNWHINSLGKAWTIIGSPDSSREAYIDIQGGIQPRLHNFSIHFLIYDRARHRLYSPLAGAHVERSLMDSYLPAPIVRWNAGGINVENNSFVADCSDSPDSDTCFSTVKLDNKSGHSKNLFVYAIAVPYEVVGQIDTGLSVRYDRRSRSMVVDGNVLFSCDSKPDGAGVLSRDSAGCFSDVTNLAQIGSLPRGIFVPENLEKINSGAMRFAVDLEPGKSGTLTFRMPLAEMSPGKWANSSGVKLTSSRARMTFVKTWRSNLSRTRILLPDRRYSDCFYASLAYLMILSDDGVPQPGAFKYQTFWVRDCAYISNAYYFAGRGDLVRPGLDMIHSLQVPGGGFNARLAGADDVEYDAPGEAIYSFVQDYRRTGDIKRLARMWPSIRSACEYIRQKRLSNTRTDSLMRGIMPPSLSAEDIGKPDIQHYWDDFWCIRGLRDAAFAARKLGRTEDAAGIEREARTLLNAILNSIDAVQKAHSIPYIPNGPKDVISSAMARGTSCAIWPCDVLDPNDPLTRKSFNTYWDKWIARSEGGFEHKGHYWPYAGLDLAMDYLILDQRERSNRILRWTLDHDSTDGFYSWPEGMYTKDLTLAEGDMPHGWTCASYISLLRNMLVRESSGDLLIFSGAPIEWFADGKEISFSGFSTEYGVIGCHVRSLSRELWLSFSGRADPPGALRIILPRGIDVTGGRVDGRELKVQPGRAVSIPSLAREVVLRISRSE